MTKRNSTLLQTLIALTIIVVAAPLFAQSALTLGEAKMVYVKDATPGAPRVMQAPVYLETNGKADNGDPLQSFAFRIKYEPQLAVKSITIYRAGAIGDVKPLFEATPERLNEISYLGMFPVTGGTIHFKTNEGEKNLIAVVEFTLADDVMEGSSISLTLDDKISTVANLGGTVEQSYAKGNLRIGRPVVSMVHRPVAVQQ